MALLVAVASGLFILFSFCFSDSPSYPFIVTAIAYLHIMIRQDAADINCMFSYHYNIIHVLVNDLVGTSKRRKFLYFTCEMPTNGTLILKNIMQKFIERLK